MNRIKSPFSKKKESSFHKKELNKTMFQFSEDNSNNLKTILAKKTNQKSSKNFTNLIEQKKLKRTKYASDKSLYKDNNAQHNQQTKEQINLNLGFDKPAKFALQNLNQLDNFVIKEETPRAMEMFSSNENTQRKSTSNNNLALNPLSSRKGNQMSSYMEDLTQLTSPENRNRFDNLTTNNNQESELSKVFIEDIEEEDILEEKLEHGMIPSYKQSLRLNFDDRLGDFSMESEAKHELFKVTEEDTHQEKFSITVESDKFRTKSLTPGNSINLHSELNSLKKKGHESESTIKDIYSLNFEKEGIDHMISNNVKLSVHKKYEDLSSSNDAKYSLYKSDQKNKHFNTLVRGENDSCNSHSNLISRDKDINCSRDSLQKGLQYKKSASIHNTGKGNYAHSNNLTPTNQLIGENGELCDQFEMDQPVSETRGGQYEACEIIHEEDEKFLENMQESFSDQEELKEDDSSCVKETYTVDSSSDEDEGKNPDQNNQSLFSNISQVSFFFYIKNYKVKTNPNLLETNNFILYKKSKTIIDIEF